jgi:hypothetical protein
MRIPDLQVGLDAAEFVLNAHSEPLKKKHRKILNIIWPYPNVSTFLFGLQFWKGCVHKTAMIILLHYWLRTNEPALIDAIRNSMNFGLVVLISRSSLYYRYS